MHSVTKYLGGHSDVVMGALVTSDEKIATEMYRIQNSSGAVTGPMDSFGGFGDGAAGAKYLRGIAATHHASAVTQCPFDRYS